MENEDRIEPNGLSDHQIDWIKKKWPKKFIPEEKIFGHIRRGDRLFIGTGCGQPQYLIRALTEYVKSHPKAFVDTEVLQVYTLGIAPFLDKTLKPNFRLNSFFIGPDIRNTVNQGLSDYTPIFLSQVPALFYRQAIPVDVALVQTSPPDRQGYVSLGIGVDISKAAVLNANIVIIQINSQMPRLYGHALIHMDDINFALFHDEPLLEYIAESTGEASVKIGHHVARLIRDGDTIQVGYGRLRNAILTQLSDKKHLGIHTEMLSDGFVELMKKGAVDNSQKATNRGKTVACFCMGRRSTYTYLHENPEIAFYPADYTNNPLTLSSIKNLCAVNMALQIDLTGQATAESLGISHFSGIGGQTDFMRGAMLASGGRSILALKSTANNHSVSRIVPSLTLGSGVTLTRGDIHYVVTEYGTAYLHGKSLRERAMALIAIAHPKFKSWLLTEAKKMNLIYPDQMFIPGKAGEYPEYLETYRTTRKGLTLFLRPVKMTDEPLMKDFFYSLTDKSMYRRFFSAKLDLHHEDLQKLVVIDYSREMGIVAVLEKNNIETIIGFCQYHMNESDHTAEISIAVMDEFHRKGIARELLSYMTTIAIKRGLFGFTATILESNGAAIQLFEKMYPHIQKKYRKGAYDLQIFLNVDPSVKKTNNEETR